MPRKPASDSITGKVAAEKRQEVQYPVPDGLQKLSKIEQIAWDQYTAAKDSWKASDLRGLHKLVRMETRLHDLETEAHMTPHIYEKGNGDLAPHPIHAEVRHCEKQIQAQLRVLGLNSPHNVAVKNAGEGQTTQGRGKRPAGKPQLSLLS